VEDPSTAESLFAAEALPLTEPWFCPQAKYPVSEWMRLRKNLTMEYRLPPALYVNGTDPHWFCDKMKPDVSPWPAQAARYTKRDLAIGIFSGDTLALGRGEATLDTWLADVPNAVVHTPTAVPAAITVGFAHRGMVPDYDPSVRAHEAQHVQLYGLQDLYTRYPHAKWYYVAGCDSYLNVDYALRMLSGYDADKDWWITKWDYPRKPVIDKNNAAEWNSATKRLSCPAKRGPAVNTTLFPGYEPRAALRRAPGADLATLKPPKYTWSSGSWSWFFSRSALRKYAEVFDAFEAQHDFPRDICICADVITGVIMSGLGVKLTAMTHRWESAFMAQAVDGSINSAVSRTEYTFYHYVRPRNMVAIHERALHEKLDRLLNSPRAQELVPAWAQRFSARHKRFVERKTDVLARLCTNSTAPPAVMAERMERLLGAHGVNTTLHPGSTFRERIAAHCASIRAAHSLIVTVARQRKVLVKSGDIPDVCVTSDLCLVH